MAARKKPETETVKEEGKAVVANLGEASTETREPKTEKLSSGTEKVTY